MAATVNITRVEVLNNPASFTTPFSFEIEYACNTDLQDDLEWKMIYVGCAESEKYDQVLDTVLVGPVIQGNYKFTFEGNPPDPATLPQTDIVGVTVVLLTCSYKGKEFIRVGYYLNNEYTDEQLRENPPEVPRVDQLTRSILASDPRVTRFPCDFDSKPAEEAPVVAPEGEGVGVDKDVLGAEGDGGLLEEDDDDEEEEEGAEEEEAEEDDVMEDGDVQVLGDANVHVNLASGKSSGGVAMEMGTEQMETEPMA